MDLMLIKNESRIMKVKVATSVWLAAPYGTIENEPVENETFNVYAYLPTKLIYGILNWNIVSGTPIHNE